MNKYEKWSVNMIAYSQGKVIMILILLLLSFGIGSAIGISMGI
jgi:hypothetical protein